MDWVSSDEGWRIVSGAVVPFVAIVVAGVVAALIGRAALRRVVRLHDDEARSAAVAGIVSAARKASVWSSLGAEERTYADHLAHESSVRLRLLPIAGPGLAANWAEHELADIKRDSVSFSFQAEQSLADFRDRLIDWQHRPSRRRSSSRPTSNAGGTRRPRRRRRRTNARATGRPRRSPRRRVPRRSGPLLLRCRTTRSDLRSPRRPSDWPTLPRCRRPRRAPRPRRPSTTVRPTRVRRGPCP